MVDWIGKQLGNYAIIGLIGRGGMSSVYRAQQTTVQREVAIKVLDRVDDLDPGFVARFEREVKIIASLEHIHILPIYDYGQAEGYSYLVMRYIDGGSLNARTIANRQARSIFDVDVVRRTTSRPLIYIVSRNVRLLAHLLLALVKDCCRGRHI